MIEKRQSKQPQVPLIIKEKIITAYIKNTAIAKVYFKKKWVEKKEGLTYFSSFITNYTNFGYTQARLEWDVSYSKLPYPDTSWSLIQISLLDQPKNDTILAKDSRLLRKGSYSNPGLVAFNNNTQEIKFISGGYINHSIEKDFNLDSKHPKSYLPFIKLKLFSREYNKIKFLKKEGNILTFLGSKINKEQNLHNERKWSLNTNTPDVLESGKTTWTKPRPMDNRGYLRLGFDGEEDKRKYLFNSLMKNLYLYRFHQLPNLAEKLKLDTNTLHYTSYTPVQDSLLPDYDEYLNRMHMVKYNLRLCNKNRKSLISSFQQMRGDSKTGNILFTTFFENLEFYYIYKDTIETLRSRPNKDLNNYGSTRYDYYYQPEEKLKNQQSLEKYGVHRPPPSRFPPLIKNGGDPNCSFYNPHLSEKMKGRTDYYLVALDTKTKEVYFISGKDIYLTKALKLYPPINNSAPKNIAEWKLPYKLQYIKDRLYHYQVSDISEDNIVSINNEKVVLNVSGTEYGKKIELKVIFHNDNPEVLSIEKM